MGRHLSNRSKGVRVVVVNGDGDSCSMSCFGDGCCSEDGSCDIFDLCGRGVV